MIIFINGPFGVGKTTVADLLVNAIPNSMLYDPEEIGLALRNILQPIDKQDDFQHYSEWRSLTVEAAEQIKTRYNRHLIIPMTIWRKEYFLEVTSGLKEIDRDFYHFCLTASIEAVHDRLNHRGEQRLGSWAHQQAIKAVPAFNASLFEEHINSELYSPQETSRLILSKI